MFRCETSIGVEVERDVLRLILPRPRFNSRRRHASFNLVESRNSCIRLCQWQTFDGRAIACTALNKTCSSRVFKKLTPSWGYYRVNKTDSDGDGNGKNRPSVPVVDRACINRFRKMKRLCIRPKIETTPLREPAWKTRISLHFAVIVIYYCPYCISDGFQGNGFVFYEEKKKLRFDRIKSMLFVFVFFKGRSWRSIDAVYMFIASCH